MNYNSHGYKNSLDASGYGGGLKPNSSARGSGDGDGNGWGTGTGYGKASGEGYNQLPFELGAYVIYIGDGNGKGDGTGRANGKIIF